MKVCSFLVLSCFLFSCSPRKATKAELVEMQRVVADSLNYYKQVVADLAYEELHQTLQQPSFEDKMAELQARYVVVDSVKSELMKRFDMSLAHLDSMTGYSNEAPDPEVTQLKNEINRLLRYQKMTKRENRLAGEYIAQLNRKIGFYDSVYVEPASTLEDNTEDVSATSENLVADSIAQTPRVNVTETLARVSDTVKRLQRTYDSLEWEIKKF